MDLLSEPIVHDELKLYVHQAVYEYLSGVDPSIEWEKRGFKASNYHVSESKAYQDKLRNEIEDFKKDDGEREEVDRFVEEALDVYDKLLDRDIEPIRSSFNAEAIYFISGPPRTGGTYLLKALLELRNTAIDNYNFKLLHDYIPSKQVRTAKGNLAEQVIFEWAQWIVWARRELDTPEGLYIPKKYMRASFQLDMLREIFGTRAKFVVTSRNPAEAFLSYRDRFFPENLNDVQDFEVGPWKHTVLPRTNVSEDHWQSLDFSDQFLLYWCAFYMEILTWDEQGSIIPLKFGTDYEDFLQQFARDRNQIYFPEKFEPSERKDLPSFSGECDRIRKQVENQWEEVFGQSLY